MSRLSRALVLSSVASMLVACGGLLGFGDDDDDPPASVAQTDASVGAEGSGDPTTPDAAGDATDDVTNDAADDVSDVPTGDAGIDAPDQTPVDAGPGILVLARFEGNGGGVEGADGADVASNMLQSKLGAIDGHSARTDTGRPALLGWTFDPQPAVFVGFSLRIVTMPAGNGAALALMTGSSSPVAILIGGTGTFALRSGTVTKLGGKMVVGTAYRVAIEVSATSSTAAAGFALLGDKVTTGLSAAWTPGTMDALQIGTNDAQFAYVIDDVVVSTTPVK